MRLILDVWRSLLAMCVYVYCLRDKIPTLQHRSYSVGHLVKWLPPYWCGFYAYIYAYRALRSTFSYALTHILTHNAQQSHNTHSHAHTRHALTHLLHTDSYFGNTLTHRDRKRERAAHDTPKRNTLALFKVKIGAHSMCGEMFIQLSHRLDFVQVFERKRPHSRPPIGWWFRLPPHRYQTLKYSTVNSAATEYFGAATASGTLCACVNEFLLIYFGLVRLTDQPIDYRYQFYSEFGNVYFCAMNDAQNRWSKLIT